MKATLDRCFIYQLDHTAFLNKFPFRMPSMDYATYYQYALDYINTNGIKTYGVLISGTAKDILKLHSDGIAADIVIDNIIFDIK